MTAEQIISPIETKLCINEKDTPFIKRIKARIVIKVTNPEKK
jgi:hypothetical protein